MKRHLALLIVMLSTGLAACTEAGSATPRPAEQRANTVPNPVVDWAAIIQPAVHNPAEPRPAGSSQLLHTIIHLAVYDAVVAIGRGYEAYATPVDAPDDADLAAAVATAAYRAARGRVATSQFARLDQEYDTYLRGIPEGAAKADGVKVGEAAAAGILARRANDGLGNAVSYRCGANPPATGEFEPNGGCGTEPVDAKLAQVVPFTFAHPAEYRPDGPDPFTSERWAADFREVKDYGRADSTLRTAEQTDVAYFWSEHGYVHWNRNLNALAVARGLDALETARLFAMAHTAAADAIIAGFEAKYFFRTWRPRTAIARAADDGNPATEADPAWKPLLSVNHPEYPSGHAFYSTALTDAVAAFFGTDKVEVKIVTSKEAVPQLMTTERTYSRLTALMEEVGNARVWSGLHYRNSMDEGAALGHRIAEHVTGHYFRPHR
jgi:vanadium-dependent haloperoxidase-like protein